MCFGFNRNRFDARFRTFMELSKKTRKLKDRLSEDNLSQDEKLKLKSSLKKTKKGMNRTMNFLRQVSA